MKAKGGKRNIKQLREPTQLHGPKDSEPTTPVGKDNP
jgi:hypothetical protein